MLTLWGVATLVFLLFTLVPGDPAQMMLGKRDDPEALAAVRAKYGLDQPLSVQYVQYLGRISPVNFTGEAPLFKAPDFGESFQRQGQKVSALIGQTFPNTALLALVAIGFAVVVGGVLGAVVAYREGSMLDQFLTAFSALGMSLPSFFTAVLFAWIFAYLLGPWTGLNLTGSLYAVDDYTGERYLQLKNLILPALTLGIRPIGVVLQLTRNSVLQVAQQDFVRTARAKGLKEGRVFPTHPAGCVESHHHDHQWLVCIALGWGGICGNYFWLEWNGKIARGSVKYSRFANNNGVRHGHRRHLRFLNDVSGCAVRSARPKNTSGTILRTHNNINK